MVELRCSGGCLCGAVRYQVAGPARHPCYCHCNSCRRAAGAPFVAWGTFAHASWRVTGGELAEYRSSGSVVRGFCARCGGALTYRHAARAADIDVTLASLDEAGAFPPRMHVWVADKLPWVMIDDGLAQFSGAPPDDAESSAYVPGA
jgi:hypothetical protein